ncbi:MAG: hypothetical protein HOV70_32110 [Streptomyces sp.]|nr:hypothetical protein [Streptomyces sp.]
MSLTPALKESHTVVHAVGSQAAGLLLDRLEQAVHGTTSPPVRQVHLQPSLVIRASCGARPTPESVRP